MKFKCDTRYLYTGRRPIRKSSGATSETEWECVAVGERFAVLYFDGRKCGTKETTVIAEHGDGLWQSA